MSLRKSDYVYHPPSGSNYPGKEDANPYVFYPPEDLRKMIPDERDEAKLAKMKSALRQWERIYQYPGYPWRLAAALRRIAGRLMRMAEINPPAVNIPYYQDSEVPEGLKSIMNRLKGVYDNYDHSRFDYSRQGERPKVDIDTGKGNFLAPSEPPIGDSVKTKGEGADPDVTYPFPPTGGNISQY